MSFASDVKKELTMLDISKADNARAELSALMRMNGSLGLANMHFTLNVQTENAATARRILSLLQKFYDVNSEISVRRQMKLKKNNLYVVRITQDVDKLLDDLRIFENFELLPTIPDSWLADEGMARSYLRGAFLAAGSVNNPETSRYHFEIYSLYEEQANQLEQLINQFDLNAKTVERRSGYIVYLKEAEKIADMLNVIGATEAMLKFEDVRIVRDMRNSVNRLVNAEQANIEKTVTASQKQVDDIEFLDDELGLHKLPENLREMAQIRLSHREEPLSELGKYVTGGSISKSGVNHRLRKISQLADELRTGGSVPKILR
ncbi:putative sporulation transcription factor [Weissella oryzae SG25]|uniref:Probable cell division protein WhiA n=1 Tax=Weissella oryzae (strain DSM 25784 / JCM 18191 / LMG 30913 / SG25) TaxID=1329250 RepID=A0A069D1Y1_WEIOS|nr:DNA-binding protein WhiA [Weissella oryzae]GAK31366.1 putative sporulation transcription factor [Weissella oryzae SG25]